MRGFGQAGSVHRKAWGLIAVVGGAISIASLGGCSRESDDALAVRKASEQLISASGNGASGVDAKDRGAAYAAVISEMNKVESSAKNPGVKAAASVLAARALIGQGELAAEQCRDQRIAALMEIARLRSVAMLREDTVSLSGALGGYDPTSDLAALDGVARQVSTETESIRARIKDLDGQIAEVRAQIGERMERSRQLREQDSTIRLSSTSLGATQRADAITNATTIRREADALEKQASELELSAQGLETTHTELEGVATSLEDRSQLLAAARTRIQDSAKLLTDESAGAQKRSDDFHSQLVEGFETLRTGPMTEMLSTYEESIRTYSSAASKAGTARSTDAVNAALTSAAAYQAAADLHRQVAQSLALAAALAEGIGQTDAAKELGAKHDEVVLAAGEAIGSAASAFQGVRGGRDQATTDAIAKLVDALEREGRRLRGEPEPTPEPAPDEQGAPSDDGTTPAADGTAPAEPPASDAPAADPNAPAADPAQAPPEEPAPDPIADPASAPSDTPADPAQEPATPPQEPAPAPQ